jgi:uncharacterized protein YvpB
MTVAGARTWKNQEGKEEKPKNMRIIIFKEFLKEKVYLHQPYSYTLKE